MAAPAPIEPELKLKRFLYLCFENSKYTANKKNNFKFCQLSEVKCVFELIEANKETIILDLIETVNNDPLCANRATLLYVLAVCVRNMKCEKQRAYTTVLKVCNSTKELYLFIRFAHSLNKNFSHGLRRIIRNYYLNPDPLDIVELMTHCNSYFGWTHRDVIKQIHLKPANLAQDVIFTYFMYNLEKAKQKIDEKSDDEDADIITDIISQLEKLDSLKHCQDEQAALTIIKDANYNVQQFPVVLLKSQVIWEALIPTLEIPDLLNELSRLNKMGFLKNNTPTLNKVVELMADAKKCQTSKIQPAEVFIHLKTFERGKPLDPQKRAYFIGLANRAVGMNDKETKPPAVPPVAHVNPPKNNAMISAFYKLLQHSYKNIHQTGRRIMIAMDVRHYMDRLCFVNKTVTCIEAAILIALSFVKVEKDVTIVAFNDASVTVVPIEKGMTFNQAQQKLKQTTGGNVKLVSAFDWALENKKQIDVFINLLYSADCFQRIPKELRSQETPIAALKRYRNKMRLPNTKLITVSLAGRKLSVADDSPHVLDICGFDHNVPKVIQACCKGVLQ